MTRQRISTSVDGELLARARRLDFGRDSELFDAALGALIDQDDQRREIAALERSPYDADTDLQLDVAHIDWDRELPYDGDVPDGVMDLARQRRAAG